MVSEIEDLIENANRLFYRGACEDGLKLCFEALKIAEEKKDAVRLSQALGTIGNLFQRVGRLEKALQFYGKALSIQEKLAEINPHFNDWVATTLNNLGALLSDMGRPEDAKERYERALEMHEALLKTAPENTIYRSGVVKTTLTLGQNNIIIGDSKERKDSLQYFDEAYKILVKKAEQFSSIGLKYESLLALRLGLSSKLKYNARVIELEKKADKRAAGYRECATLASRLAGIETEEEQKKKWSDTAWYYEGRALVNDSIMAGFNRENRRWRFGCFYEPWKKPPKSIERVVRV